MYPHERREALLTLLSKHGFVSYRDLADELGVSEVTIRRDLRNLKDEGLVETVVGGGQVKGTASEVSFMSKRVLQQESKQQIARAALKLIEPGMTIGFTAGTTTWTLAQSIRGFQDLTFVTNSTNVALGLTSNGYHDIYLTGGHFRTPSDALVGPLAETAASQLHTDLLFMGVHGIHRENGLSTPNVLEASINRVLMRKSDRVVLLFDHTKWGVEALAHIAALDEIDDIVTDTDTPETSVAKELGIQVHIAT
ncbi:DeoR/GlpR family DNA-binding transcription regulator [Alicyclobacillus dauci]|uniref:DeoR/GlpR family DNA-binding transcription regulator n=1 Tax=Alicyclobacillus dauci TaxID=1475485 RepID=A0ABY6YZ97_9BACL|nr:DeoR/GlpR family DNA-binding transcription regulator [Alicyclobacillus dauci]WAH35952.1 DeoR/GlpR family DNA-binding transcription regulator [Alicyclobacillus dauci]